MRLLNPATDWPKDCGDGCGNFFGACLRNYQIDIPRDAHVLEIGCAEFDWLDLASKAWPEMRFWGIDWREYSAKRDRVVTVQGDARDETHYPPNTFDWVVSISAMEHMGLSHYDNDPPAVDGDTEVMTNAIKWLKPGGWLVFDVPWQPKGYEVCGSSHRVYDPDALFMRLWCEPLARAKATARWVATHYVRSRETSALIERPTQRDSEFYYVGCMWQKL